MKNKDVIYGVEMGGWATRKQVRTYSLSEGHRTVPGAHDGPEQWQRDYGERP